MSKSVAYRCDRCYFEGSYVGALRFEGQEVPKCKDHGPMQPVQKKGKK